jgi:glucosyl-dolichyl phosphate glucuronosyltransferase
MDMGAADAELGPVMDRSGISVIICAYTLDRWDDLCAAVGSLRRQVLRPDEIVVVVDYNPTLLERAKMEFHDVVVVPNREARGLSGGRNTGLSASTAPLVAFLDDDAVADPHWLSRLAEHCGDPNVLGVGARVAPVWIGHRPGWLPEEFLWTVGCSYRGLPETARDVRNGFGGAMLFKRHIFGRAGGFAAQFGRQEIDFPLSCEDTEMCMRAKTTFPEGRFVLEPASVVWHKVPSKRLTWAYFRLRCYAEGASKAYFAALFKGRDALATERQYVLWALSGGFVKGLADFLFRGDFDGLKRSVAITLGLTTAAAGYFTVRTRLLRLRMPPVSL